MMHIPTVTSDDLARFGKKHFNLDHAPPIYCGADQESFTAFDEDELGYYYDGIKRTLTDEQIAIFRHSEVQQAIRRENAKKAKNAKRKQHRTKQREAAADKLIEQARIEADQASPAPDVAALMHVSADEGEISEDDDAGVAIAASTPTSSSTADDKNISRKRASRKAQQGEAKRLRREKKDRKRERDALERLRKEEAARQNEYTPRREAREQDDVQDEHIELDY